MRALVPYSLVCGARRPLAVWTLGLWALGLAGCVQPAERVEAETARDAVAQDTALAEPAVVVPASLPSLDVRARTSWGEAIAADSFRTLLASADTSVSGSTDLISGAGPFFEANIPGVGSAQWQALRAGEPLQATPLVVTRTEDSTRWGNELVWTAHVTAPGDAPDPGEWATGGPLAYVRRPASPFPLDATTVFAGEWAIGGRLTLTLGDASYTLSVVEGPEVVLGPSAFVEAPTQRSAPNVWRPERVLMLSDGAAQQAIASLPLTDWGPSTLQWAGDLDGDGRLDVILYESPLATTLFLSSEARPGDLVRRVARHEASAC